MLIINKRHDLCACLLRWDTQFSSICPVFVYRHIYLRIDSAEQSDGYMDYCVLFPWYGASGFPSNHLGHVRMCSFWNSTTDKGRNRSPTIDQSFINQPGSKQLKQRNWRRVTKMVVDRTKEEDFREIINCQSGQLFIRIDFLSYANWGRPWLIEEPPLSFVSCQRRRGFRIRVEERKDNHFILQFLLLFKCKYKRDSAFLVGPPSLSIHTIIPTTSRRNSCSDQIA